MNGDLLSILMTKLKDEIQRACDTSFGTTLANFMTESPQKFCNFLSDSRRAIEQTEVTFEIITDVTKIEDEFKEPFQSVFSGRCSHDSHGALPRPTLVMPELALNMEGIFSYLLIIDEKKTPEADGIPNTFLKRYAEVLSQYLYVLFRSS